MKKALFILCSIMCAFSLRSQKRDCGTVTPATALFVDSSIQHAVQYTSPLLMKVFVHVIANDNGSSRATEDTSVFRQLENMRQFYAPHGICFILAGVDQINSTDLNTHNASTEESELNPFIIAGVLNIFIHRNLSDNNGTLNGIAYNIPNYYISVVASAIESVDNRSTTAHEIGHCFGLYHTFETAYGVEHILRSGSCLNCITAGDLLCDTEADPHSDSYDTGNFIDANCIYSGSIQQTCSGNTSSYNMDPHNIMAYGRRACRDIFTNGQGNRAASIITSNLILQTCIAPDSDNITSSQTISSGRRLFIARNSLTVNATSFIVQNSANVNISSSNSVIIKAGTEFKPSTGDVQVIASSLCQ